ncbi:MAG TPA: hypothetical protein VEZ44_13335 [bacterium]|nr:hypothetical protein [bacterium]
MREPDALLRHLRHAEEWLRWARSDYRKGDLRGAVLRLLLAEAEVRHAREAGSLRIEETPARPFRRTRLATMGAFGAAAVLAVAAYGAFLSGSAAPHAAAFPVVPAAHIAPVSNESWGVVRLDTGDFLTLMSSGPQASPGTTTGAGSGLSGQRVLDELMSQFGQITPTSAGGPVTLATPGDPDHPAAAF